MQCAVEMLSLWRLPQMPRMDGTAAAAATPSKLSSTQGSGRAANSEHAYVRTASSVVICCSINPTVRRMWLDRG